MLINHDNKHEFAAWYAHLQEALKQTVQASYDGRWEYSLISNKGLGIDFFEIEDVFEIVEIIHDQEHEELVIYAKVGQHITTARKVHETILRILARCDEAYLILIPAHNLEETDRLNYWFMTGYMSHGHIGRIILRREDNPQVEFDITQSDI